MTDAAVTGSREIAEAFLREFLEFIGAPTEFTEEESTTPGAYSYAQEKGEWRQVLRIPADFVLEPSGVLVRLIYRGSGYSAFWFNPHTSRDGKRIFLPVFLTRYACSLPFEEARTKIREDCVDFPYIKA